MWTVARWNTLKPPQTMRFGIVPPPAQRLAEQGNDRDIAISPDGSHIVYRTGVSGQTSLAVRAVDQLDAHVLAGVNGVRSPFISADGHWVGFFTGNAGEIKKVSITGGPPITLCRITGAPRGASWGADDTIVFATNDPATGLLSVPSTGGEPKVLTKPDTARGEGDHLFPFVLPGGRAVLFAIHVQGQPVESAQVAVLDIRTGQKKILIRGGTHPEYVETGHLVYAAAGTLRAVRFDLERLEVLGDPVPVVEQVATQASGAANFTVSRTGTLVYVPGGAGGGVRRSLAWVNRQGREEPINAPPRAYAEPRLSPDGTRVAVEIRDQENDIWIWDLMRQTPTRFTFDPGNDLSPVWTPDSRRIIFTTQRGGISNLYWQAADNTGMVERLTTSMNFQAPTSISPDGKSLVFIEVTPGRAADLNLLAMDGQRATKPLIHTTFIEVNGEISPDGRWIAYQTNESGQDQVYVRPFPNVDSGRWLISTAGGTRPLWARNGRELFYVDGESTLMAVPIQTSGQAFNAGSPAKVFDAKIFADPAVSPGRTYDVSPDGQRFLVIKDNAASDGASNATVPGMVVVTNWFEELKARTGVK
jgi:serine/threonine-protein kinase